MYIFLLEIIKSTIFLQKKNFYNFFYIFFIEILLVITFLNIDLHRKPLPNFDTLKIWFATKLNYHFLKRKILLQLGSHKVLSFFKNKVKHFLWLTKLMTKRTMVHLASIISVSNSFNWPWSYFLILALEVQNIGVSFPHEISSAK